jgi:hypothetical protein
LASGRKTEEKTAGESVWITNGEELTTALQQLAPRGWQIFCGQSHELFDPRAISRPFCAIANLDSASGPGTHWVAFCSARSGPVYYCDSLGDAPPAALAQKLKAISPDVFYNSTQIQPDESDKCGFFALDFCARFVRGARGLELYGDYTDGPRAGAVMAKWDKKVIA